MRVSKGMREKTRRNEGKDHVKKEVTRISSGLLLTLAPESEPYLKVAHHFSWEEFLARLPPHFSHPSSIPTEGVIDRSAKTMLLPPTTTLCRWRRHQEKRAITPIVFRFCKEVFQLADLRLLSTILFQHRNCILQIAWNQRRVNVDLIFV